MQSYKKPMVSRQTISPVHANGASGVLLVNECSNLVNRFSYTEDTLISCVGDIQTLAEIRAQVDFPFQVGCSNIGGSYTLMTHYSSTVLGGGACTPGFHSVSTPITISPDLPSDCQVNSFISNNVEIC